MENLIPEAMDGSEFAETVHDMSQAQAEKEFGAEFETDAEEMNGLERTDHD